MTYIHLSQSQQSLCEGYFPHSATQHNMKDGMECFCKYACANRGLSISHLIQRHNIYSFNHSVEDTKTRTSISASPSQMWLKSCCMTDNKANILSLESCEMRWEKERKKKPTRSQKVSLLHTEFYKLNFGECLPWPFTPVIPTLTPTPWFVGTMLLLSPYDVAHSHGKLKY